MAWHDDRDFIHTVGMGDRTDFFDVSQQLRLLRISPRRPVGNLHQYVPNLLLKIASHPIQRHAKLGSLT